MTAHVCTVEECGHTCALDTDGTGDPTLRPWRDYTSYFGDAGQIDGEGPCDCKDHDGQL